MSTLRFQSNFKFNNILDILQNQINFLFHLLIPEVQGAYLPALTYDTSVNLQ